MPAKGKLGVCCTCQLMHPVDPYRGDDIEPDRGPEEYYVMSSHDAFGMHCDGTGTTPQALVKD